MSNKNKFLQFNDHEIYSTYVDGQFWVGIKPLCEAIGVNYNRQAQNLRSDKILGQLVAEQQLVGADKRQRFMMCLPERYVYGWLFSIRSNSPKLLEYKKASYDILYDHFHGVLTKRKAIVGEKKEIDKLLKVKQAELDNTPLAKEISELKKKKTSCTSKLSHLDRDLYDVQEKLQL